MPNLRLILSNSHIGRPLRIGLALFCTISSVALALILLAGTHHPAHAATFTLRETYSPSTNPWGITLDNKGNEWVAEPGCDPTPICASVQVGSIAQIDKASFTVFNNFTEPAGYSSPVFLALDSSGNIWFTEPMTNSIGELTVNFSTLPPTTTWKQWTVPTANAAPFDLTFDAQGYLWFTEIAANQIGEFIPSTQTFYETPIPTANSKPYGIVGPEPITGDMWFTEDNNVAARIGRFTPPTTGQLNKWGIKEYLTNSGSASTTPHMITYDGKGGIWWSEGPDKDIGHLFINQASNGTNHGVSEYTVPFPDPNCPNAADCSVHISGIAVDSTGNVWFDDSDGGRIGYYNPNTNTFTMLPSLALNSHPHDGFAIDGNDTIFFAEEFANKLGEVVQSGIPSPTPTIPILTPTQTLSPTPTKPPSVGPGPVNKIWYFAEGRVGKGFRQYLTIDNPSAIACGVNIQYLYTMDGGSSPLTKTASVTIAASSRVTESVNYDLSIADSSTSAASLASTISVNSSTPSCTGVVAERPLYFMNFHGISSGTDVLGSTSLNSMFYFADVPTGTKNISYITILNPNNTASTVTATYYANAGVVGTQSISVAANSRGTISPGSISLPTHVTAVVTSSVPVMVERPTYFTNGGGNASISGAYDVVGATTWATDWLFAEGYTGIGSQEYLTISNLDVTSAAVTVILKSRTGATASFQVSVPAKSQTIWNVNTYNIFTGSTPEVSVEVTSVGGNIVVQREMYFQYKHTLSQQENGGTDVMGQIGPASHSSYSFAEGYNNIGYNEWLTIQNPTVNPETIYVTLVNGKSQSYTENFVVSANSRYTQDITVLVQQAFKAGTNSSANSVSMTVQTVNGAFFVAERPMYWNTKGISSFVTNGGSDIIGYAGG